MQQDVFGLVGTTLEGKFCVEAVVAEGGFGVVYRATHLTLERPLAIKVLKTPPEFNDDARREFIERFALEAKTIARLDHPSIVHVLDFGASRMPSGEVAPWMALEWLTGQTLDELLAARRGAGGCTPEEALALLRPVLEAVAYAHDEGIAHRDLKPANIMVTSGRRGGAVKLMDFGIAKLMHPGEAAGTGHTRTSTRLNAYSPRYAAPEQVGGMRTGPWTDVYALSLILYEILTDQPAYPAESMTELLARVLAGPRPTPALVGMDVGPWEPILQRAMTLEPSQRIQHAGELLAALAAHVPARRLASVLPPSGASAPYPAVPGAMGFGTGPGFTTGGAPGAGSPTTMRGAVITSNVTRVPRTRRVRGLLLAAGGLAMALGGAGIVLIARRTDVPPLPAVGPVAVPSATPAVVPASVAPVAPRPAPAAPSVAPRAPAAPSVPRPAATTAAVPIAPVPAAAPARTDGASPPGASSLRPARPGHRVTRPTPIFVAQPPPARPVGPRGGAIPLE